MIGAIIEGCIYETIATKSKECYKYNVFLAIANSIAGMFPQNIKFSILYSQQKLICSFVKK